MKKTKEEIRYTNMPDLTRVENGKSVAKKFEILVQTADKYKDNPEGLKKEIIKILDDATTHVSKLKANRYKEDLSRINTFRQISQFVTNLYLKGAKLGLD